MDQLVLAGDPIICIFSYLGPVSLCRAAQVSKNWLVASEDSGIWSNLWRNLFVFEGDERLSLCDGYNKSSFISYFKNHGGNFRMDFALDKGVGRIKLEESGYMQIKMTVDNKDWSFCGGGINTSEYLYSKTGNIDHFENEFNLNQFKPSENSVGPVLMNNNFLQKVGSIFKNRDYHIMHCLVYPSLIQSFGEKEDYFQEQHRFYINDRDDCLSGDYYRAWMPNKIVELPNTCHDEYEDLSTESLIPQFLIHPMQTIEDLDKKRVEYYRDILNDGIIPTVLALGMVEMRTSYSGTRKLNNYLQLHSHVCDGHHKLFAASQIGKPVYLLLYMLAGNFMSASNLLNRGAYYQQPPILETFCETRAYHSPSHYCSLDTWNKEETLDFGPPYKIVMYNLGFDELFENDIGWFWEEPDKQVLMGFDSNGFDEQKYWRNQVRHLNVKSITIHDPHAGYAIVEFHSLADCKDSLAASYGTFRSKKLCVRRYYENDTLLLVDGKCLKSTLSKTLPKKPVNKKKFIGNV